MENPIKRNRARKLKATILLLAALNSIILNKIMVLLRQMNFQTFILKIKNFLNISKQVF